MAIFQTWIFHLDLCVVIILLIHADYSKSNQEAKIKQNISKTVFLGNTVTLHCNKTTLDDDFTWGMNNSAIFRQISNRTQTNFSSNRIHIDPAAPRELKIQQIQASDAGNYTCYPAGIRWTLTITENRPSSSSSSPEQMLLSIIIFITIISCFGVILICLISICFHKKQKRQKIKSSSGEKDNLMKTFDCDKNTTTVCVYSLHTVS
ncbi:uncharacterized protein LOC130235296 isoform X2 [Danio aesculapii]|uniref:uncharacterized protein LOC130235296 isoform X2 n=1 Tax=Danio aesculapii TaxID=1142201 RepID=UPI0024BFF5EC|nr:uncharacterized protein LOC130235296 isoform X2 [Danio aesculapii]